MYFPVTPGQVVTFGGWIYRVSGDGIASWRIQGFNASKSIVAHAFPEPSNVTTVGSWTLEQGTYTVPTGVAYVRFLFDVYRSTVPTVVRFDDGFLAIK